MDWKRLQTAPWYISQSLFRLAGIAGGVEPTVIVLPNSPLAAEARVSGDQATVAKDEALRALGVVHPVIEAGHVAVVGVLDGALASVVAYFGLLVALEVAVGVLAVPNHRGFSHQYAAVNHGDGSRHDQLVQEIRHLVRLTVVVGVLEDDDLAYFKLGLVGAFDIRHVAAHLDHPGPPVLRPRPWPRGSTTMGSAAKSCSSKPGAILKVSSALSAGIVSEGPNSHWRHFGGSASFWANALMPKRRHSKGKNFMVFFWLTYARLAM